MNIQRESAELEAIKLEYTGQWGAGDAPPLAEYVRRYPSFAQEITDYVLDLWHLNAATQHLGEQETISPATESALSAVLAAVCPREGRSEQAEK